MLTPTPQRRAEIVRLLAREGAVRVSDLASRYGVSEPTIRRDLEWLEQEGLAHRVRGGAVAASPQNVVAPGLNAVACRIGQTATGFIRNGETVFLGPGKLTLEAARALRDRHHLTVVTNSLTVAAEVAQHTPHTLILTGGQLNRSDGGLEGHLVQATLRDLRADWILIEPGGVNAAEGLTDDSLAHAELYRALLERGRQVVVLVEPEQVGRVAAVYVAPITEADVLVTAREADSALLWDLAEAGIRILLA